jgi:hypothetical protein
MQGVEVVTSAGKQWGLQALVMLSFLLQVMLLVLAEFRRRIDSGVLRLFVWSAYMLADATAIYVLGHMSVTSTSLMVFWAPFLLLHLGGQGNITAYAIEDNQLWLRHLQTLAVQVAAAAYVLYESPSIVGSRRSLLLPATILMFAVGVLKYGERVWALKCASTSSSGSNYRCLDRSTASALGPSSSPSRCDWDRDTEAFLLTAHILLDAPMDLLKGPSAFLDVHYGTSAIPGEDLYKVAEMQISLMHDVLYTKAEVMHTWYGLCIHMVSSLGTLAALLLFHFHLLGKIYKGHYSRVDITITYVLLVGAVVLEIMSALRAMFSGWTCALLHLRAQERNIWHYLYWKVSSLRRLIRAADWSRYWSGSMGQHNLLQLCARSPASKCSMIARWMGVEDPWNTMVYSSSIPVPPRIEQLLVELVLESEGISDSSPGHIRNSRGRAVLESRGLCEGLLAWSIDIESDESIVVWHIVTDLYLCWFKKQAKSSGRQDDTEAIEALSNYMVFLLAARPYMLPPPTSRNAYVHVCYYLTSVKCRTPEDLANLVQFSGHQLNTRPKIEDNDTATSSTENSSDSSR